MNLTHFTTFRLSEKQLGYTEDALREAGADGYERFVFWSGRPLDAATFVVEAVHVPGQSAYKTRQGLLVRVEGEALHRLNAWLYEHEQVLAAQVHAHPTDAYHSETDDTFPIVTSEGGLSIVVPDFCKDGLLAAETAVYRLSATGWVEDHQVQLEVR
jgi:hypothetical protein